MQRKHGFFIVTLMEPFPKPRYIQNYKRKLGMEDAISNVNGKIWLFFDAMVEWELVIDTEQQLTIKVYHQDIGKYIMMTFVYKKCSSLKRLKLWDNLYYLTNDMELPWVVRGDFNIVLSEEEKIGGLHVYPPEYEDFASCVNSCGLFDLGYKGSPFIWWNGRPNEECIFKRLDIIFVNLPFQTLFPNIEVEHLIRTGSDHAPLLMSCGDQVLQFKLKRTKITLSKWSKLTYGDIFKQLAIREDVKAQAELKKYLSIEEQYWKQKAESQHLMAEATVEFFQKQFTQEVEPISFELLNNVPTMVSAEQNRELCITHTIKDVKVFSGVLHNRLEKILPPLISTNQSGFVKESIFENILLTQKIVTNIRLRGKPANVVIKLDMAKKIVEVLAKYEHISGQLINKEKSSFYVHSNTATTFINTVADITSISKGEFPFTYLGYPILYTRRINEYYNELTQKVKAKLHSWKGKLLSYGGKATLISSVLQSMSTHILSVLDPPANVLQHLHNIFTRSSKLLWANFMWNKYCKKELPTVVQFKQGSHVWRKMLEAMEEVEHELLWKMKSKSLNIWHENWTGLGELYNVIPPKFHINEEHQEVDELREENAWNDQMLEQYFPTEIAGHIRLEVYFENSDDYWDTPK
ncbi:uncharacterized protein [Nicotiana tomentosiformis]|uniref:uncharacterized protein n=1 Tax=Nicotiana tomentosiformis TaxID=4098 RepID=UPI00388CD805